MDATEIMLGKIGATSCSIAITDRPWLADINAIVVSVGTGLGQLGADILDQFPGPQWRSLDLRQIRPAFPAVVELPGQSASKLWLVVLATPHQAGGKGVPTASSLAVSTSAAIKTAAHAGAKAVGLPLLATGTLGFSAKDVAAIAVPSAVQAISELPPDAVRRLVFVCRSSTTASEIQQAWDSSVQSDAQKESDTDSDSAASQVPAEPVAPREVMISDTELAGGVSSDLVPDKGIPPSDDHLGVQPYVSMLAAVIADRNTPMPLSVGIFGEWGSGKSFFMGLLRHQVAALAKPGSPTYCGRIDQIRFNAWHYADSNLWASLGDEIFRQLANQEPDTEQQREKLRAELGARLYERRQLEEATKQARVEAAALQASVDEATAKREAGAKDLIKALRKSETFAKLVNQLWSRLGVSDDVEQGRLLAEQMHGTLTEADALRRSPWDRSGKIALAAAAVLVVAGVLALLFVPAAKEFLSWLGGVVTVVAGFGITALGRARSGLRKLRELTEDLRGGIEQARQDQISVDIADNLAALRAAEAKQRIAEAQLTEVVSRVGELGRQLAELTPGRRLYTFLAERAQSNSYGGNLGLISVIRKDFEQLVKLMNEWRAEAAAKIAAAAEKKAVQDNESVPQPVERIVLYIDDLDRCSPRQVVDVLQAVHLLLALELFVVVVGVDPRWLVRSLCSHYDEILEHDQPGGGSADGLRVTPEDYLEKILNIPLVLPKMSAGSLDKLLRSMAEQKVETGQPAPDAQPARPADNPRPADTTDAGVLAVEKGSELDAMGVDWVPRPLTDPEIELLTALDPLVDTPREAKRLFNLFRMLRATRGLSAASQFLGDSQRPGEYQAIVVLLGLLTAHARLLGRVLDTPPDSQMETAGGLVHRSPDTRWRTFVDDFEPLRSGDHWTNGIVGSVPAADVGDWARLHRGLLSASEKVTLTDVSCFQRWVPVIRRFSYVLSPAAGAGHRSVNGGSGSGRRR